MIKIIIIRANNQKLTALPSYLRPTTRECVHLDMFGYILSHHKDGGHTSPIQSTIVKNPMLHANLMAVCVIEAELWPTEELYCGNRYFGHYLLLWPWPWANDLHIWTWHVFPRDMMDERKWTSYVKAFESYHLTDRHREWQTWPKLYITSLQKQQWWRR